MYKLSFSNKIVDFDKTPMLLFIQRLRSLVLEVTNSYYTYFK